MPAPIGYSLTSLIKTKPGLVKIIEPIAKWYLNSMGYRRVGLKYDDLLQEENPTVQRAIKRLTPREQYDRAFRIKQAQQASVQHKDLPRDKWTKPEDDVRYLRPHIEAVMAEDAERKLWDNAEISMRKFIPRVFAEIEDES